MVLGSRSRTKSTRPDLRPLPRVTAPVDVQAVPIGRRATGSVPVLGKAPKVRCLVLASEGGAWFAGLAGSLGRAGAAVRWARDGNEALDSLGADPCDFILADGDAPSVVELLLITRRAKRPLPFVILGQRPPTTLEQRILRGGRLAMVSRQCDPDAALKAAMEAHATLASWRSGSQVPLAVLCEFFAIRQQTCTLEVASPEGSGWLYLSAGRLVGALAGEAEGLAAARAMLRWRRPVVEIRDRCPSGLRQLDTDLHALAVEALGQPVPDEVRELFDEPAPGSTRRANATTEGSMIALESYLDEFKGVKGYIASGIMDFTGEALAVHSLDPGVKLEAVGAVFNDIFRSAHEASKKIGLDACNNMALVTPKGIIVMECSGANKTPHLHVIAILQEGGNQALAKMTMAKILPLAVKDLT